MSRNSTRGDPAKKFIILAVQEVLQAPEQRAFPRSS